MPVQASTPRPACPTRHRAGAGMACWALWAGPEDQAVCSCIGDRKSTRLNSSHLVISYAVFCLKKKKISTTLRQPEPPKSILILHQRPLLIHPEWHHSLRPHV